MKNKKLVLSAVVLAVAVVAIAALSAIRCIAKKPTVTAGEFPFSITYELDGETVTIREVYRVRYVGNGGYADTKTRIYVGEIGTMGEDNTLYTLKKEENGRIELCTNFYPDYMMGDSEYDYFDGEPFAPQIYYYDAQEVEYRDEETLAAHGVKLIGYEYPTPIENSLVFSHLSYCNSAVVIPSLLIAALALLLVLILVRKEQEWKYTAIDTVSIVLNCLIGALFLPFITVVALLLDVTGGGAEFYYQTSYFMPALTMLCIAASVALRRQGHRVKALVTTLIGPAVFALLMGVCGALGLL